MSCCSSSIHHDDDDTNDDSMTTAPMNHIASSDQASDEDNHGNDNVNSSVEDNPKPSFVLSSSCSLSSSSSSVSSIRSTNDDTNRRNWWKWVMSVIVSSSKEEEERSNSGKDSRNQTRRIILRMFLWSSSSVGIALVLQWLYRRQRRQRRYEKRITFPWNPKSISSLMETPFALAFAKVKEGLIEPPLYMNEMDQQIVYYDKMEQSWKRSTNKNNSQSSKDQIQEMISSLLQQQQQQQQPTHKSAIIELLPQSKVQKYKNLILQILVSSSPFLYLIAMYYMLQKLYKEQQSPDSWSDNKEEENNQDNQTISLQDVAGMESLISELSYLYTNDTNKTLTSSSNYHPRKHYNTHVLLYGPPGNGKTLLARALANSLYQRGIIDAVQCCNASDFVELYVGQGAKRIRSIFGSLKKRASSQNRINKHHCRSSSFVSTTTSLWSMMMNHWLFPYLYPTDNNNNNNNNNNCPHRQRRPVAILIIDELDALAKSRQGMSHNFSSSSNGNDEREQTLLALLTELDSALLIPSNTTASQNDSPIVLVMGATNRPNVLDPAFVRRFSKQVYISNPDDSRRYDILQHFYNLSSSSPHHPNNNSISISDLVPMTDQFSASDLQQVIQQAEWIAAMEKQQQQQQQQPSSSTNMELSQTHLEQAIQKILQQKSNISNYMPSLHNYSS